MTAIDLNKCLKQIGEPKALHRVDTYLTILYKYHGANLGGSAEKVLTKMIDTNHDLYISVVIILA